MRELKLEQAYFTNIGYSIISIAYIVLPIYQTNLRILFFL